MSNQIEITEVEIVEIKEKKPRKKWTAQNPRKKRVEGIRKPSKYADNLPFDENIRYKYNRTYYEKNREQMLQKMKEKYQSKSKKNKINNAINLLKEEEVLPPNIYLLTHHKLKTLSSTRSDNVDA
jgi:hypothetical protein